MTSSALWPQVCVCFYFCLYYVLTIQHSGVNRPTQFTLWLQTQIINGLIHQLRQRRELEGMWSPWKRCSISVEACRRQNYENDGDEMFGNFFFRVLNTTNFTSASGVDLRTVTAFSSFQSYDMVFLSRCRQTPVLMKTFTLKGAIILTHICEQFWQEWASIETKLGQI